MIRSLKFLLLVALLGAAPAHAAPAYLVDADWLAEHIDDDNLVVLEVRYHPHRYFTVGHIPGAVQVQRFKDLGDNAANPLMRFPTRDAFQATLRRWGVNDDSTLVLYDDSRTALASRLYFLLALSGFPMDQVKVMNGGTVEWSAFNELSQESVAQAPGNVTLKEADARWRFRTLTPPCCSRVFPRRCLAGRPASARTNHRHARAGHGRRAGRCAGQGAASQGPDAAGAYRLPGRP